MKNKNWELYIIKTNTGKLYTGITTDLERRVSEHKSGKKGAKFFNSCDVKEIVFREKHKNRSEASKREYEIKKMNRDQKLNLIGEKNSKLG